MTKIYLCVGHDHAVQSGIYLLWQKLIWQNILLVDTESPCLMPHLVLEKIRISQMFGMCDLPNANFGLLISLVQFFVYFCPRNCSNEINRPKIVNPKCFVLKTMCSKTKHLIRVIRNFVRQLIC